MKKYWEQYYAQIIVAVVAVAVTWTTYRLDRVRGLWGQSEEALRLSRQISMQVESLALYARQNSIEKDPLQWAARYFSQGTQARVVQVSKVLKIYTEDHFIDPDTQRFEFIKVSYPEKGEGLRVVIQLGYRGFLAAQSRVTGDFLLILFFSLNCWFFWNLWGQRNASSRGVAMAAQEKYLNFKSQVMSWAQEAHGVLTQLGVNFRELVRSAHQLAQATQKSREAITQIRMRIHERLTEIHTSQKELKEAGKIVAQAESLLMRIRTQATASPDLEQVSQMINQIRKIHEQTERNARQLEITLEPLVTDADIAFHAYANVHSVTEEMSRSITQTKQAMLGQARLMKDLGDKAA